MVIYEVEEAWDLAVGLLDPRKGECESEAGLARHDVERQELEEGACIVSAPTRAAERVGHRLSNVVKFVGQNQYMRTH
jgi:hypothetical protein